MVTKLSGGEVNRPRPAEYEAVPPEERKHVAPRQGVASTVKTIVVHDEQGKIISVTRVAPDAKFGVGVKAKPGQTIKEYEAGSLAADPFSVARTK